METILEAIGHTPLIQLTRSIPAGSARVFAKLERFNPGGSLKDRIVLRILGEAEKSGKLKVGGTVVAGTTGNSGIALAYIGNVKKLKVILTMPENFSLERRRTLECYGADVRLTPAEEGMKGAINRAREIAKETGAFLFAQFEDPETATAHELTTAKEILDAVTGAVDAFVAGVGTSGTIMGVGRVMKSQGAAIIAVEPAASPLLSEGKAGPHKIQGIGPGFVPKILDRSLIDEVIQISDGDAFNGAQEIARKEGILAGISCGAAFAASLKVARKLGPGKTVVTVFPDGGERYFSMRKYFKREGE
ncbi:MAG TPA: cysteine synthase A [bacterium]|nr:cysteine synthase A [bacterium]